MVKDKKVVVGIRALIVLLIFFFSLLTIASGAENAENGVRIVDFKTHEGRVKVFLPDDISAGDTVSAAIRTYPSGKTPGARNKNLNTLNSYIIEAGFFRVAAGKKSVKIDVPRNMAGAMMKFTLRDSRMGSLGSISVPVSLPPPVSANTGTPSPFDYQCPLVGQAGRLVQIKGPFDGDFATTDLRIGSKKADMVAESPRKLIFESPTDMVGSVEVVMNEEGVVVNRPFTCLQVMKIGVSGAVPEVRSVTGDTDEPSTVNVRTSVTARRPGSEKLTPPGGMSGRELPPATHTLQFESIKAEETLSPSERPEANPRKAPVSEWNDDKGSILARQLDSPPRVENSPAVVSTSSAVGRMTAATENGPLSSAGESLTESHIKSEAGVGERNEARVTAPSPAPSDKIDHAGRAESGSEATVIEGQLLASFTGGPLSDSEPETVKSKTVEYKSDEPAALHDHKVSYTVQVASYRNKKEADGTASRLRKKGYHTFVVPASVPGKGRWYRVRVGVFSTKREAASFAAGLKMKERFIKSAFVSEND